MLSAATKIQRAWRHGTLRRTLNKREFFTLLREDKLDKADPSILENQDIVSDLRSWTMKLMGGEREAYKLASHPDLIVCWVVVLHKPRFQGAVGMVNAASLLVYELLQLLDGGSVRNIGKKVRSFLLKYSEWKTTQLAPFMRDLRGALIARLIAAHRRRLSITDRIMVGFQRLHTLYCIMDHCATGFTSSPVYRAIIQSCGNPCCAPAVSQARLMNELILNNDLKIPFSESNPELNSRNTVNGRIVDSQSLRDDILATMIGFVNEATELDVIANVFEKTKTSTASVFASEVFGVFIRIAAETSISQQVRFEWESNQAHPLEALVLTLRMVRNLLDNALVDASRQRMEGHLDLESLTRAVWATMQVTQTHCAVGWIRALLGKCDRMKISALASANPFALIEFFDASIVDIVLNNTEVDYLEENRLPEFLDYNRDRLVLFRIELSAHSFQLNELMELINADKWMGSRPCSPSLQHTAKLIRSMLKLCRFCHGCVVNALVTKFAKEAATL